MGNGMNMVQLCSLYIGDDHFRPMFALHHTSISCLFCIALIFGVNCLFYLYDIKVKLELELLFIYLFIIIIIFIYLFIYLISIVVQVENSEMLFGVKVGKLQIFEIFSCKFSLMHISLTGAYTMSVSCS